MEIMLDVKKLITGFLILALGASTAAWILSGTPNSLANTAANVQGLTAAQPLGDNAFIATPTTTVPEDVADLLEGELPSSTELALNDPNNLTAALGNSMLDGLISANPNGIQTDSDGNGQINQPDDQAILTELSGSQSAQNIDIPNWDVNVVSEQAKIKTSPTSSAQSVNDYLNAFNDINDKYFVQTGLQQAADAASTTDPSNLVVDPSIITTANTAIPRALSDTMRLTVPAPFLAFQKSWVKLLIYERNIAELLSKAPTDPARTTLTLTLEENNYTAALGDFNATFQKTIQAEKLSLQNDPIQENAITAFLNKIFSINVADAQGVFVPVNCPTCVAATHSGTVITHATGWGTFFKNLALDIALQLLKNTLMAQLQSHVIKWIQNSGAPMFVQNWANDFANAAIMSATNYINSNFACIGTANLPKIQLVLNAIYKPGNNACASQFASQLSQGNLTSFLNNFKTGGFLTFGQTLMPSNDFYGSLYFAAQGAANTAQQSQSLFSVKTTAQQGFKGAETCTDQSNPNGFHCQRPDGSIYNVNTAACNDGGTGTDILIPNDGQCANGQPPTTQSPGQTTGMMLNQSLGTAPKLIAGASTIDGIINAFTISLINALASTLVQTATGAINGAINSLSSVSTGPLDTAGSAAPTSTLGMALSCNPANQNIPPGSDATFDSYDSGTYDASGNPPNYTWTADPDGGVGAPIIGESDSFDVVYNTVGSYTVRLSDDQGDPTALCLVNVTTSTSP